MRARLAWACLAAAACCCVAFLGLAVLAVITAPVVPDRGYPMLVALAGAVVFLTATILLGRRNR
jgi:hypothetical protein